MVQGRWLALGLAVAAMVGFYFWPGSEAAQAWKAEPSGRPAAPAENSRDEGATQPAKRSASEDAERLEVERKEGARSSPSVVAMFENPKPTAKDFYAAYRDEICECSDRDCVSEMATRYAEKMTAVVWGDPSSTEGLISEVKACHDRAWGTDYIPTDEERRMEFEAAEAGREDTEMREAEAGKVGASPVSVGRVER
jgi:hypothetical protein